MTDYLQGDSAEDFLTNKAPETGSPNDKAIVAQPNQLPMAAPAVVLDAAKDAAKALQSVIAGKTRKVVFNNEQYLEFEDWQTLGKFYGITAKVTEVKFVEYGEVRGFEATAVALNTTTGMEISSAQAMCLNDENNWKAKPLFQLKSMAQTRACSKALRNVLAWVAVLAGYKPTPAEEMDGVVRPTKTTRKAAQKTSDPIMEATAQIVTGEACSECHAPVGKPHATKCSNA